jgi:hypothetical protein
VRGWAEGDRHYPDEESCNCAHARQYRIVGGPAMWAGYDLPTVLAGPGRSARVQTIASSAAASVW